MISKFAIAGTVEDRIKKVSARVGFLEQKGINQFALLPVGRNIEATIKSFAEEYARLREIAN